MKIIKDILYNYWFPLLLSVVLAVTFTVMYGEFDIWYFIGMLILSGVGIACIVYFFIKLLK